MTSENFRETIQPFCISVEGFPSDTDETQVRQIFPSCLRLESVLGAQPQQTKWLICFRDRREADHYLNLKEIKIRTNLTLKISVCILCDIPTSWEKIDLKSLVNPVIIPQINPAEFPPNYSPHGVAPGNHGYHPGYQNPAYAGYGAGPPMHPPPMYPYGGQQQMPSQMGSMPSEGGDYISYPGISTPPGHQGPHPIQGQGQEGKSPAVVEGEGHEQPEVTSGTHLPQEQSPVPGTPVQSPDGRIGQDKQEKQDETYSSMPPYLGYPYQGPGYHMHYPPTQYTPRFPGPHPLGHPPPYSQFPRQPASNSPVRMAQPHNVPNYPLPADQTPDTEMESSESNDGAAVETAEEEPNNMIKVTGISSQTSEENLILFFENKRKSGGGEIETIDFQGDWAIIAFEDSEVVDSVLQKSPLILDKKQVTVERFVPQRDTPGNSGENIEEEEEPLGMIKVSGFSSQTTEETLEMFFENKRKSGGGDIEEMDFQGDYAIITFVNPEVVDSVLQKSPLILDKKQVTVERFIPQKDTPGNSGENIEEEEEPLGMIKVSGFSSQTTEDTLEMFFENKRKSGGGDIEEMDFQEDFAIITFVNPEVVDRILQKLPLLLDNKQIKVERFVPERSSTGAASVEETRPSCTIEVRGINSETSVDTLENYFGNKKAAGKTVEVVRVDDSERDEQGVVYITYETKEVMNAVLSRRHKLDGATLEVAEYIPPPPPKPRPMYADKVLIKGKSPNTTKDGLENFLEAKTGITPKHVLHGEEEDVVLVTFEEPPDFEKLEKACMKKALDKNYLKVFKVPISNCVLVRGTAEKTTASTLEYYFENTRRSGGGDVLEVKDREDGSFLILFVDHTVVDRVLERSHTVDNTTLDVKLFHELLGESGDDGPKFKVPDTLVISDIDPRKVQFLQNSKPNKDGLEKQLSSQHTQIIWPENLGDPVKLECLLTKEIKDCRTLAKAWKDTARLALDRFLDVLSVFKHDILQEAWGSVIGELQNMNISHPDGVSVAVEKVSYEIFVMGHKKFAAEVSQSVEKIIKVIVDELERKKKQISETTRALKHYQVMMLSKTNYKETVEKKYRGMKVILDFKARTVTYEGLYGEVNEAKANLFETISALVSSEVNDFSKGKYKYLQEKAVKQYVAGKMKDKNITAVWEMQNSKFLVFAMSDEGAVNAAHILKDSILETSVDVKKESLPLLATEKWSDEEQNIKGACTVLVYISVLRDKPCILIYATDVDAEMVRERVSDFLINNTIYDTKLPLGTGIIRFLQSHCVREIQDIEQRHKLDQVTININNLGLEIKGTEVGLSKAKQDVNAVISQVARKKHVLRKPGITKLMTSEDSKPKVSQVEKIHRVVIVPSDESDDDVTGAGPMPLRPDHTQEMARCSQPGYELMVVMGDITNLKVDVLVNAANRELQHNGGLAKAIVQKGGNAIQDDCNRYIRQHRALMEGDVYMGKAGSLQCNYIAHAVGPKWQGGRQREKELLTEAVLKCLEETNIYQQTSIALPALGAGVFGYPAAKSTQTIVDAIDEFFKDNPRNTIQNIYLCDVSQNNVDLFVKALQKVYGQMSVIIADATGGARDKWSAQKAKPRKGWKNVTPEPDMPPSYPEAPVEINITITLVKGQIANQKVDMIVNTCSKDLKLSNGAVSSSLLAAAGPQMQAECDQNYQGIQFGEIAVTQGYNLQCHCVCHGSLPGWDGGASALVVLQKFMLACLREATQQGYESVAFPAMGTGNLSYPRDTVAREMYKIVSKYSTQNPTSPVRNVMFVIYDKDLPTVKAFEDAEKSQGKAHNLHGQVRNRHTRKFGNKSQEDKGHSYHQDAAQPSGGDGGYDEVVVDVGSITLKISQGDITQTEADAIVNGTNCDFDLSKGNVSKVIKHRGGKDLEVQVNSMLKEMKRTGIACTTSDSSKTGMPCTMIIHLNVDSTDTNWKKKFLMAMDMAESRSCKSLAFPALGTGIGSKPEDIASAFVEALVDFERNHPDDVKEVRMVVYQQDMIQKILSAMQMTFQTYKQSKGYLKQLKDYVTGSGGDTKKNQWSPRFNKISANAYSFAVMVYGKDQRVINMAISDLEGKLDETLMRKIIEDDIIKTFTGSQESQLDNMREKLQIDVTVEKRIGRIQLLGLPDAISNAVDIVHRLMLEAQRHQQAKQEAQLISDMVQWYYIEVTSDGEDLQKYDAIVNRKLEKGHRDGLNEVEFEDNNHQIYVVDLQAYEEYIKSDPSDKVKVIRRSQMTDSTFDPPNTWAEMKPTETMTVVNVPQSSKEFETVSANFMRTLGEPKTQVHKIERVQNRTLYQQFVAKKRQMDSQNPTATQNERMLWHGTAPTTVDSINAHGFNRSYCGKNAVAYGNGVYFAVNSRYSAQPQYSVQDANGYRRMYQCRVLTGEFAKGQGGMRVPPTKGGQGHILYDSVVDKISTPSIFVIFHDTQAYPEYLITFS